MPVDRHAPWCSRIAFGLLGLAAATVAAPALLAIGVLEGLARASWLAGVLSGLWAVLSLVGLLEPGVLDHRWDVVDLVGSAVVVGLLASPQHRAHVRGRRSRAGTAPGPQNRP